MCSVSALLMAPAPVAVWECRRASTELQPNPPHSLKAAGELLSSSSLWNTKYWSNQSQILLNFKERHQVNSPFQKKKKKKKTLTWITGKENMKSFFAFHLSIYNLNEKSTAAYILYVYWSVTSKNKNTRIIISHSAHSSPKPYSHNCGLHVFS